MKLESWREATGGDAVLFTSGGNPEFEKSLREGNQRVRAFREIHFFRDMPANDLVEKRAIELHARRPLSRIVGLTEMDLLRAARVRARLGLEGQTVESTVLFRDKVEMKELAKAHGMPVARFRKVRDTVALLDFIGEVGYPVIVKPIAGRGSAHTFVISDEAELDRRLEEGLFSDAQRMPDLLVEEFIRGEMYHVDGLRLGGRTIAMNASRYLNTCLSFVDGSILGSHMLDTDNPLRLRLEAATRYLLEVFPTPDDTLFHAEFFVTPAGRIVLCEVACRLGGNGINDEVRIGLDVNILFEYVRAQCRLGFDVKTVETARRNGKLSGRLLIPPSPGTLARLPKICPFDWVERYTPSGKEGAHYEKMAMSNAEIASFLLVADSEAEITARINQLTRWFFSETIWSGVAA